MNPFDLPGPQFLQLYVVVLALGAVAGVLLRWFLRMPGSPAPEFEVTQLDPYEAAYLAGGDDMAVDACMASLVHSGATEVDAIERRFPGPRWKSPRRTR